MKIEEIEIFISGFAKYFKSKGYSDISQSEMAYRQLVKISEEVGELSDQVLGKYGLQRQEKSQKYNQDELASEIADVILSVSLLAHDQNIDISKALKLKMTKVKKRFNLK